MIYIRTEIDMTINGSKADARMFFRDRGVLRRTMQCIYCNESMKEVVANNHIDGAVWKCLNNNYNKYKTTLSIRKGFFFEKERVDLRKCLHLLHCWCYELSKEQAHAMAAVGSKTIGVFFKSLGEKIGDKIPGSAQTLGGSGIVVQIDESAFIHKPKYHRVRSAETKIWVFGLIDTSTSPATGYMEIVENRRRGTIYEIIRRICKLGTIIHSDQKKSYFTINSYLGFDHDTVNHSIGFVNQDTGTHTQNVESIWSKQKLRIKKMKGIRRTKLNSYLKEFMFRDNVMKKP